MRLVVAAASVAHTAVASFAVAIPLAAAVKLAFTFPTVTVLISTAVIRCVAIDALAECALWIVRAKLAARTIAVRRAFAWTLGSAFTFLAVTVLISTTVIRCVAMDALAQCALWIVRAKLAAGTIAV
jgi:hypothetical protein